MRILWTFSIAVAMTAGILDAAGPSLLPPLATSVAPPCSVRQGVRMTRSSLVEMGGVSVSLASQAVRDGKICSQSSALGVTVRDVSEQFELPDPSATAFAIQDISGNGSEILLTSSPVDASREGSAAEMAVVPVADGSMKWMAVSQLLQMTNCDGIFHPEGFFDSSRILIAVAPRMSAHERANCTDKVAFYLFEPNSHRVTPTDGGEISRLAHPVSGPLESCNTDPDLAGACYRTRGRLALKDTGDGMLLWTFGSNHYLSVEPELVPGALSAQISPDMRIYASMLVCPMVEEPHGTRAHVCIESASGFKADPITPKNERGAGGTR